MNKKLFSWKALAGLALLVAMGMTSCKNITTQPSRFSLVHLRRVQIWPSRLQRHLIWFHCGTSMMQQKKLS